MLIFYMKSWIAFRSPKYRVHVNMICVPKQNQLKAQQTTFCITVLKTVANKSFVYLFVVSFYAFSQQYFSHIGGKFPNHRSWRVTPVLDYLPPS
jgi:hypothetical protein